MKNYIESKIRDKVVDKVVEKVVEQVLDFQDFNMKQDMKHNKDYYQSLSEAKTLGEAMNISHNHYESGGGDSDCSLM